MHEVFKNPKYRGKHIIIALGKIYTAKTGKEASAILDKIEKEHPQAVPQVTYIPKQAILIV